MDFIDHRSTANFIFSLSATDEKFRITNNGDVGIGTSSPSTKLEVNGVITTAGLTTTADINFGDNDKAVFGAGSDLQIFHDGSHSYITDVGTGDLRINGASNVDIRDTTGVKMFRGVSGGEAILYHNNDQKLATTSTGIDVTGTAVTDGLTVDTAIDTSTASFRATTNSTTIGQKIGSLDFFNGTTNAAGTLEVRRASGGNAYSDIALMASANGNRSNQLLLSTNGDISFYEDTGTTAKLFWDASAESLGIGTSSPASGLELEGVGNATNVTLDNTTATTGRSYSIRSGNTGNLDFYDNDATTARVTINSSGNVGIGTSSPSDELHVYASSGGATLKIESNTANAYDSSKLELLGGNLSTSEIVLGDASDADVGKIIYRHDGNSLAFNVNAAERMRIDSSGNVLIGMTNDTPGLGDTDTGASFRADGASFVSRTLSDTSGSTFYVNRNTNDGNLIQFQKDGTVVSSIGTSSSSLYIGKPSGSGLMFQGGNTIPVTGSSAADATYDLGASAVRFKDFYLSGTANAGSVVSSGHITAGSAYSLLFGDGGERISGNNSSQILTFVTAASERARIDASGNLLVGKTSFDSTTVGASLRPTGAAVLVSDGNDALLVNRKTSDGSIIDIRKDNTTVGSIGTAVGNAYYAGTATGITFGSANLYPTNASGTKTDGALDIGSSSQRFKDLYLSGAVKVGSGENVEWSSYSAGTSGVLWTGNGTNNTLDAYTTGSLRLRIDSSGNVGIGSTAPAAKLDIVDTASDVQMRVYKNDGVKNTRLTLTADDSGAKIHYRDADNAGALRFNNNLGEVMRITANTTRVGIGTTDPTNTLTVFGTGVGNATVQIEGEGGADPYINFLANNTQHWSLGVDDSDADKFKLSEHSALGTNDYFVVDVTGNVGIGTSNPSTFNTSNAAGNLVVGSGSGAEGITIYTGTTSNGALCFADGTTSTDTYKGYIQYNHSIDSMQFATGHTERMRLDSSGNLLVGKTAADTATVGAAVFNYGMGSFTRASSHALDLNRTTSDGSIINLRKDNTAVGSIGTVNGDMYLGTGDTGFFFSDSGNYIMPYNTSTLGLADGLLDLGRSTNRFQDLYLSGGVYLGGTGSANHLDDYEEGTYVATLTPSTSGSITLNTSYDTLSYTKVGRMVSIVGRVRVSSVSSPVGTYVRVSLPFNISSGSEDETRVTGAVVVQQAAQDIDKYCLHPQDGTSYVAIGRTDNFASNAANDFSGNELVAVNFTYIAA